MQPIERSSLMEAARRAAGAAYCQYSGFRVGAAVLAGGRIVPGCNVENASYGLSVCAERVAIFSAIAAGARTIDAIAVACPDAPSGMPVHYRMPCGACRQVMAEFAADHLILLIDQVGEFTLDQILPSPFRFQAPPGSQAARTIA